MFRTIVILGILAVCAFMAGWFTIHRDDQETTIRFNRDEIRADTSNAIAKGREFLNNKAGELNSGGQADQEGYPVDAQYQQPATDGLFAPQQATRTVLPWQQPENSQSF